ncbi:MAG: class I SAM-dependent methyltransferase [Candidatus Nanopelagicales bacterium]
MRPTRLGCFVLARNESPILDPFLDQLEALFDVVEFVDHSSTDDTPEKVSRRDSTRIRASRLVASGYPQSQVATFFARRMMEDGCDWVFFLDCDEFLPFAAREALDSYLLKHSGADVIRLPWLNVCPADLSGVDIFSGSFQTSGTPDSRHAKIALSSRMVVKAPTFVVEQGYHGVRVPQSLGLTVEDCSDTHLVHVPIQSEAQAALKIANGASRIRRTPSLLKRGLGGHWVHLAQELQVRSARSFDWRRVALGYPDEAPEDLSVQALSFDFPYVCSPYQESSRQVADAVAGLLAAQGESSGAEDTTSFSLTDSQGAVILSEVAESPAWDLRSLSAPWGIDYTPGSALGAESRFTELVEPLFNLPTRLPVTAWSGHIPFLFTLFGLMRPTTYVELGVHNGASFIAAATAARTFDIDCQLYGIDSWEGDAHAGHYDGDAVYADLKRHIDANFSSTVLMRSFFDDARQEFRSGSIDLLHIDGLHTYDAVSHDFATWLPAMKPDGVILFHDIAVYERGFGVHRLWGELKEIFTTIEFPHSFGLGVVFLNPDQPRIRPLLEIADHKTAWRDYQELLSLLGGVVEERMGYFTLMETKNDLEGRLRELEHECLARQSTLAEAVHSRNVLAQQVHDMSRLVAELETELSHRRLALEAVMTSRSWRLTAPLRRVRGG